MDHFKFYNKRSHKVIKFVFLVSVFSFMFSFLPLLLQSLNEFFNLTIAKSYMFLLCNGLLVFIANNSGLITTSPSTTSTQAHILTQTPEFGISEFKELHLQAESEAEAEAEHPQDQEDEEEDRGLVMEDSQKEERNTGVMAIEEEEEEEEGNNGVMIIDEEEGNNWVRIMEEEEEHEAEEETEELNKKCEDFIRKMKAAFCSEPRDYYNYDYNHKALVAVM